MSGAGDSTRYIKFWPQDWVRDPLLRRASIEARGLWIDLLCLMADGTPYGHLTISGEPATVEDLAHFCRIRPRLVAKLLAELKKLNVYSETSTGIIYSRRMVRDGKKSIEGKQAADKRWNSGNAPIGSPNRSPNRGGNGDPNTLKSESYSESESGKRAPANPDPGPSAPIPMMPARSDPPHRWEHLGDSTEVNDDGKRHAVVGGFYLDVIANSVCEAAGIDDANWRGDWRPVASWLRDKLDPDTVILPAIRSVAGRPGYNPRTIRSLAYFDAAVREGRGGGAGQQRAEKA